jgi:hypothetical protein
LEEPRGSSNPRGSWLFERLFEAQRLLEHFAEADREPLIYVLPESLRPYAR